jgi:hypothetical protein
MFFLNYHPLYILSTTVESCAKSSQPLICSTIARLKNLLVTPLCFWRPWYRSRLPCKSFDDLATSQCNRTLWTKVEMQSGYAYLMLSHLCRRW